MMQFTPEQRAALDLHLHCAVHANAGSGKTSVVTHRFVKILVETGTPLDQMIAITFTRAAAAEMRERIHRLLTDAQQSPEIRASFATSWSDDELCRQLRQWSLTISTARISTFHSFCAGLVRQYAEELSLDADLRDIEGSEASLLVDESVRRALSEHLAPDSPLAPALTSMFDDVSVDLVHAIVSHATRDTSFAAALADSSDANAINRRRDAVRARTRIVASDTMRLLEELLAPLSEAPHIAELLATARDLIHRCTKLEDTEAPQDIRRFFKDVFTTKHELRATYIPKELRGEIQQTLVASSELRQHISLLSMPWDEIQEQRFDEIVAYLHRIATSAREHYRSVKRERNAIDFDDMIHLTLQLLKDESVVLALRKSVRYIMVDEFQDTDPLQYEVLSRIAPALLGEDAPTPNVCIVGDDKQSIYGFRDADVRLFRRATYAIQRANTFRGTDTGYRPLVTSFRMHERLATSVNAICSEMFGAVDAPPITDTMSFDVGYQPLRSIPADTTNEHVGTFGVVPTVRDEPTAIADVVGNILQGRLRHDIAEFHRATNTWTTRAPRPSDIAILVQTNPQVVAVGEALSKLHIPVDLHGGASFFARPEVADIRAVLTACIAPTDNLAVATVCRSPLLRCTDADIAAAALLGRRSSLRDGIARCVADGKASENLLRAHILLTQWEAASMHLMPAALVQRALDESGWYSTLELEDRREQILANVEKALEIVRNAVDGNGGTLYDAVTALSPVNGDRERDGFVPSNSDAVRVMTIHASKGLEFGIVVLGGLNKPLQSASYLCTEQIGVSFSITTAVINAESPNVIEELPALKPHALMKLHTLQRELAEFRRRLYVALTRAKMHAVVMHTSDTIDGSLLGMAGVLGDALAAAPSYTVIDDNPSELYQPQAINRVEVVLLDPIPASLPDLVAPTQFIDVHQWDDGDDRPSTGAASGAAYGIAVHDVLAMILPDAILTDATTRLASIARGLAMHQLDRDRAAEAALEISSLFTTSLIESHADLLRSSRREVRLVGALDRVVLQGVLDCRLSHEDGSISVWDWKTNGVRHESDLDEFARVYRRQMQTYAWLCFRAYPECDTVTTRLVFTKAVMRGLASIDRSHIWHRSQLHELEEELRLALAELLTRSNS